MPPTASARSPTSDPGDVFLTVPGYNHLDVLTAAARQNSGAPEPVSTALATGAAGP